MKLITAACAMGLGLTAIHSAPVRRDIATVKADVENLKTQVIALDHRINEFGDKSITIDDAVAINDASLALDDALKQATADVQSTTKASGIASVADATSILDTITSFKPYILDALQAIVIKRMVFGKLPVDVNSLVLADLNALYLDNQSFEQALIAGCPDELKPSGKELASSIDDAFRTALLAFGGTPTRPPTTQTHPPTTAPLTTPLTTPLLTTPAPTTPAITQPTLSPPPILLPTPSHTHTKTPKHTPTKKPKPTHKPHPSHIPPALKKCYKIKGTTLKKALCFVRYFASQLKW